MKVGLKNKSSIIKNSSGSVFSAQNTKFILCTLCAEQNKFLLLLMINVLNVLKVFYILKVIYVFKMLRLLKLLNLCKVSALTAVPNGSRT